ncbi:MAG: monovalent cation:proton antiporter-2 (CPA2) family protein [Thermoanaerobaculia bacterium]|nr:monovalent cation:proton antiporter-2 (CPA2) family protein [Thermoanaerobaculia bacterium]
MAGDFLSQALIYLAAAVICVPVAKKLGMSSVLGYLLAGMLIGPYLLGLIGREGQDIMHFAEFGVVMMLFLIGLELEPAQFWKMRRAIIGLGTFQAVLTAGLLFGLGLAFGLNWTTALAIALALTMSSTAIVLQSLKEKGQTQTAAGQASFAVLLFQDILVIPALAVLPLLAPQTAADADPAHTNLLGGLPGWLKTLALTGSVAAIFVAGRYLVVPLLRIVAKTRLRELFTASALLVVIAVTWLMQQVGLSPALGAFLSGVVLANSEYRHELESDLVPFKGLLLGLFFLGVGASINFKLILEQPALTFGLVAGIMLLKALVLYFIGRSSRLSSDQNLLFALGLSQVGEFAFVLFSFSGQLNIIDNATTDMLMAVTALSMSLSPVLLLINEKYIDPYFGVRQVAEEKAADQIGEKHPVILAGFGHFGSTIGRLLRANGVETTILDFDTDRVELLRKMGFNVYYGDATRLDLLKSAGADEAKMLIAAIDSPETNYELIRTAQKHFPHLRIMARARNRFDAYELIDLGLENIYRETMYTAVHLAVDVLENLGFRAYTATRQGQNFIQYDEAALRKLAVQRHDVKQYILSVREQIEHQEELLQADLQQNLNESDHSWDGEYLRETLGKKPA